MVVIQARVMDSTHLELAEPIDAQPGGTVVVSVAGLAHSEKDVDEWMPVALQGLAMSYGESEPDYPVGMVKEPNPEYER
jgi:hypothetical protein